MSNELTNCKEEMKVKFFKFLKKLALVRFMILQKRSYYTAETSHGYNAGKKRYFSRPI